MGSKNLVKADLGIKRVCPSCGSRRYCKRHLTCSGGDFSCSLDATLTTAGFPDQTSRDAARRLMRDLREETAARQP